MLIKGIDRHSTTDDFSAHDPITVHYRSGGENQSNMSYLSNTCNSIQPVFREPKVDSFMKPVSG